MHPKQEKIAKSNENQQQALLDRLGNLAKQNKAAYEGDLVDFRDSFTLQPSMSFSTAE